MKFLRDFLDSKEHLFHKGGKLEKMYPLYEAIDTFAYTPADVTAGQTHVRDGIDLKRTMITVAMALFPVIIWTLYNTGYQANAVLASTGAEAEGWRASVMAMLNLAHDPANIASNMVYGFLWFFPVFLVTQIAGGTVELIFSVIRKHEINEGFLVTGILYPLILPPTIPLWQVALGIIFGVLVGKEIYGGTGKNIFNPALTARAFLFFAYPAQISGDAVWTAVDGYTGATALGQAAAGGLDAVTYSWSELFFGLVPGSMGETSTLACLLGAVYLIATGIGSWTIMLSVVIGMIVTSMGLNLIGSETNFMFNIPWYYHFVMGGFAFAFVFMATDPVSASMTTKGKWFYGFGIGVMGIVVRCINPAFPEGWMLAILFMNAMGPLIDYFVINSNIKRRMARNG
ncbi:MAG: NADH:ubiquinone reductase (Na(+)-transporting) subunit B [Halobacteriovoraceae bacterium]|nr:NADH:ubiquinone reductase (Na(+)-transporting) subunit B [Halobacteriovoraceae bacterium]|tara:strand:+ start:348217 stop:349416 length:1200 start_codon:yes stop_codon:yes gene_type:complete